MEKNLTEKLYEELKKRNIFKEEVEEDLEDDQEKNQDELEDNDNVENVSNDDFCDMMCNVLHSRTQAHVFHLQTTSYAEHKTLNKYYDEVVDLFDGLMESYQGKYGIIKNFKSFKIEQYKNTKKTISYFERLLGLIDENRDSVEDSFIQNQIDTIQELINSTIYKLKFLK